MSDSPLLPSLKGSTNQDFNHLPEGLRPSKITRHRTIDMRVCFRCGKLYDCNETTGCCDDTAVSQLICPTSEFVKRQKYQSKRSWYVRFFCCF